jgi:seryl-tRNA synthetase
VDEAARILGLSVDAIRKRGTIPYEKDPAGRVTIILDAVETLQDEGETVRDWVRDTPGPGADRLLEAKDETIEELRARVRRLEQDLDTRNEELRRRDHLLAAALERIPAIEAPETVAEAPEGRETPPEPAGREEATERRSWWRRWFGGE